MKNIYITENQFHILTEKENEEVTFYEFFVNIKKYLKDLLTKPADAEPNQKLLHNIDKSELLKKMTDLGIIKKNEKIDEVLVDESKKVAKHYVQYKVPKRNFEEKVKELYKEVMSEQSVFANEQELVDEIKSMDLDNAYASRGGLNEEGEGGCDTEKNARGETANSAEGRIADFRAKIAAEKETTGKEYLAFYHVVANSYEINE